ncbi:MAG TPA: hypothetical protein VLA21_04600 [Candidatus Limnocylindria bacterium]|nr:hypothetical protein [Candidatus Limnocylindria bacterium]
MAGGAFEKVQQAKKAFVQALLDKGFPEEAIVGNWGTQGIVADLAVIPRGSDFPIAIFELKLDAQKGNVARGVSTLRSLTEDLPVAALCMLVFPGEDGGGFRVLDVTDYVYRKKSLDEGTPSLDGDALRVLPDYLSVISGASASAKTYNKTLRRRRSLMLKVFCWCVMPLVSAGLLALEWFLGYELTTGRLVVVGYTAVIALLPFSSKVSIKDVAVEIAREQGRE